MTPKKAFERAQQVSVSVTRDGVAFQTDGDFKVRMEGAAGGGGKSGEMRTVVGMSEESGRRV